METKVMDRLAEIKTVERNVAAIAQSGDDFTIEQVRWLITQVERLREIEDAAIVWSKRSGAKIWLVDEERSLMRAISDNPRPY